MGVLIGALAVHVLLMTIVPSPWWAPNISLIGCTIALGRSPRQWFTYSIVAGCATALWTVRTPWLCVMEYLIYGGGVVFVGQHWHASDRRVQGVFVGLGTLGMTLAWCATVGSWSWGLLGCAVLQAALTAIVMRCFGSSKPLWGRDRAGPEVYAVR